MIIIRLLLGIVALILFVLALLKLFDKEDNGVAGFVMSFFVLLVILTLFG